MRHQHEERTADETAVRNGHRYLTLVLGLDASHQVVILSTDTEVDTKHYQSLQPNLTRVPGSPDDLDDWPSFPIPNLGSYEPPGWERTDTQWFIDKTGFGADSSTVSR